MMPFLALFPLAALLTTTLAFLPASPAIPVDEECPCAVSPYGQDTCSCPVLIFSTSGYPVGGECEFADPDCGLDQLPCEWRGLVEIACPGQFPVAKPFTLQTDCGALPSVRTINCTGGTGLITLSVICETCN